MKGLATLIKLHKRALDELRRKMTSLESQKIQLQKLSGKLAEDVKTEMHLAGQQPEMGNFFGDYAKRMKMRQQEIAGEIKSLDKQMDTLGNEIAEAFTELKKFEIAQENDRRRKLEIEKQKETLAMDEIAGQQFQRRKEE
jgi:flagellar protein FliJ